MFTQVIFFQQLMLFLAQTASHLHINYIFVDFLLYLVFYSVVF